MPLMELGGWTAAGNHVNVRRLMQEEWQQVLVYLV